MVWKNISNYEFEICTSQEVRKKCWKQRRDKVSWGKALPAIQSRVTEATLFILRGQKTCGRQNLLNRYISRERVTEKVTTNKRQVRVWNCTLLPFMFTVFTRNSYVLLC